VCVAVVLVVSKDLVWSKAVAMLAVAVAFDFLAGFSGLPVLFVGAVVSLTAVCLLVPLRGLRLY
jgi:hypothetical protein